MCKLSKMKTVLKAPRNKYTKYFKLSIKKLSKPHCSKCLTFDNFFNPSDNPPPMSNGIQLNNKKLKTQGPDNTSHDITSNLNDSYEASEIPYDITDIEDSLRMIDDHDDVMDVTLKHQPEDAASTASKDTEETSLLIKGESSNDDPDHKTSSQTDEKISSANDDNHGSDDDQDGEENQVLLKSSSSATDRQDDDSIHV